MLRELNVSIFRLTDIFVFTSNPYKCLFVKLHLSLEMKSCIKPKTSESNHNSFQIDFFLFSHYRTDMCINHVHYLEMSQNNVRNVTKPELQKEQFDFIFALSLGNSG